MQDKGVATGQGRLHQVELVIVHARIHRRLAQIPANEGEMVPRIHFPYSPDALHGRLVSDLTAKRKTRVRGVDDHATGAHDIHGKAHQPCLRVVRMYAEKLRHAESVPNDEDGTSGQTPVRE